VDPAQRLLDVADADAKSRGLEARFLNGVAAALPLADASADVIVSVFGVIFAPDAHAAVAEMARVSRAHGRIVFSAWLPGGPLAEVMRLRGQAVNAVAPVQAPAGAQPPAPFAWHDPDALGELFTPRGFTIELHHHQLAFIADSPSEWLDTELRVHPGWIAAREILEPRREMQTVLERALEIFGDANEAIDGFRVTSEYVVVVARRG
jgi:SAM-dependent methyltransferase